MSSQNFNDQNTVLGNPSVDNQPTHHLHGGEEPLRPVADYSIEALEGRPKPQTTISDMYGSAPDVHAGEQQRHGSERVESEMPQERHASSTGANAFNEERPMDVQPTQQGDVAVGGQSDLPQGKASAMDKVIGKTEKVMGKVLKKPQMHEAGELREAGGKAAARGDARAPHD
ncbi:unnamed protein product [Peniophora sp. CBMAI 1063]|nr:unnamed protein product [Peniophora sp. CBMAI 1063]